MFDPNVFYVQNNLKIQTLFLPNFIANSGHLEQLLLYFLFLSTTFLGGGGGLNIIKNSIHQIVSCHFRQFGTTLIFHV